MIYWPCAVKESSLCTCRKRFGKEKYAQRMKSIVGFAVEITHLEGKFKLSQNRPHVDRERVIAALKQQASPVADVMIARKTKP